MTDADFLQQHLSDHEWHSWHDIMAASVRERGCGLTIHSRAAQLRKKRGLTIECRTEKRNGRSVSFYRLAPLDSTGDTDPVTTLPETVGLPPQSPVESSGPASNRGVPFAGADGDGASAEDGAAPLTCAGQLSLLEAVA